MKIELAKYSGFCAGVRKAVWRIADEISRRNEEILILGPLIHNPQTVAILESRGLKTVRDLTGIDGRVVTIRTHGVEAGTYREIKERSKAVINLTCPRVTQVQSIVKKYSKQGCFAIIIGDKNHAEVTSIMSFAGAGVFVLSDESELGAIPEHDRYLVVAQTTSDADFFRRMVARLESRYPQRVTVINTICDSTHLRQGSLLQAIARGIDALVVVGGRDSANTRRLARIGEERGIRTFPIETEAQLDGADFRDVKHVLVTAGASTPSWIINNVLEKLYRIKSENEGRLAGFCKRVGEFFLRTNIFSSVMSFFMTMIVLKGGAHAGVPRYGLVSAAYVFLMYSLNNLSKKDVAALSNPFKRALYERHRVFLALLTLGVFLAAVYVVAGFAIPLGIAYAALIGGGAVFSTAPVRRFVERIPLRIVRLLYNTRSVIATTGWIAFAAILPWLGAPYRLSLALPLIAIVLCTLFVRNILLDVIANQGDQIFGITSIPILIGRRATAYLVLALACVSLAAGLLLLPAAGSYGFLLVLFAGQVYSCILMMKILKTDYLYTLRYEALVELPLALFPVVYFLL